MTLDFHSLRYPFFSFSDRLQKAKEQGSQLPVWNRALGVCGNNPEKAPVMLS
jgi:hypothetical protein